MSFGQVGPQESRARSAATAAGTWPLLSMGVQGSVRTHSDPQPRQAKTRRPGRPVPSFHTSPVTAQTQIDWHGHWSTSRGVEDWRRGSEEG